MSTSRSFINVSIIADQELHGLARRPELAGMVERCFTVAVGGVNDRGHLLSMKRGQVLLKVCNRVITLLNEHLPQLYGPWVEFFAVRGETA